MGLTPMDLFNDILTNENDLRNFLQQNEVNNVSSSRPGVIIQGKAILAKSGSDRATSCDYRQCSLCLSFKVMF